MSASNRSRGGYSLLSLLVLCAIPSIISGWLYGWNAVTILLVTVIVVLAICGWSAMATLTYRKNVIKERSSGSLTTFGESLQKAVGEMNAGKAYYRNNQFPQAIQRWKDAEIAYNVALVYSKDAKEKELIRKNIETTQIDIGNALFSRANYLT